MGNRTIKIAAFSIAQWEKEAQWLRQQHQQGWKFTHVTAGMIYHFTACEPEDVVYQLDYHPDGPLQDYLQLFADCGWEYVESFSGYRYFRKPLAQMTGGEEAIFCDRASRLDMIHRVFRRRVVPLVCIFFCILLPQLFLSHQLSRTIFTGIFGVLFVLYLLIFLQFGLQYRRLLRQEDP